MVGAFCNGGEESSGALRFVLTSVVNLESRRLASDEDGVLSVVGDGLRWLHAPVVDVAFVALVPRGEYWVGGLDSPAIGTGGDCAPSSSIPC